MSLNILKPFLKKDFNNINYKEIKKTPMVVNKSNLDIKYLKNLDYSKEIIIFINKITKIFPKDKLNYLYSNLNTLKILNTTKILGMYDQDTNTLYLNKEHAHHIIYHELFHIASTVYNDSDVNFAGFHQKIKYMGYDIGFGLNEGYTELLSLRYFKDYNIYSSYKKEVLIASILEEIIGKEEMENYYITANLLDLVSKLTNYKSLKSVIKFITMIDIVNDTKYTTKKDKKEAFNYITLFLKECYLEKLKELNINNNQKEDLLNNLNNKIKN